MHAKDLLDNMWQDYIQLNPLAQQIADLFTAEGEQIVNDHIALRTFAHPKLGIDVIARIFLDSGYTEKGEYHFAMKKLYAKHFEHPELPRVFISELLLDKLSSSTQTILNQLIDQVDASVVKQDGFLHSGRHWQVSSQEYEQLLKESEYAAWMAAFGYRPNHFTVSVNHLQKFTDVEDVNLFLGKHQIDLNESGGAIKGSEADLLKQSSTLANKVEVKFSDKTMIIPSCYYEFAKRFADPTSGELYSGFVAKSADKIFESTDRAQSK
jgi:hypothetical protein